MVESEFRAPKVVYVHLCMILTLGSEHKLKSPRAGGDSAGHEIFWVNLAGSRNFLTRFDGAMKFFRTPSLIFFVLIKIEGTNISSWFLASYMKN